jgi:hypothetical protein
MPVLVHRDRDLLGCRVRAVAAPPTVRMSAEGGALTCFTGGFQNQILFARSTDGGATFSRPIIVSGPSPTPRALTLP